MSKMQRQKGADGERELAELLRSIGIDAQRSARNGVDRAEDIMHNIPGVHIECKRVERLNVSQAMRQATDAAGRKIPTVWHRRNREAWLVTIPAADVLIFAHSLIEASRSSLEPLPFDDAPEMMP
jgi:post-segregation antitoxin (ccd killing protein)